MVDVFCFVSRSSLSKFSSSLAAALLPSLSSGRDVPPSLKGCVQNEFYGPLVDGDPSGGAAARNLLGEETTTFLGAYEDPSFRAWETNAHPSVQVKPSHPHGKGASESSTHCEHVCTLLLKHRFHLGGVVASERVQH
ncbi:hypothetical protein HPB50_007958 [Hyalomma asiaticum]|uniref:Uncharacterized protein n=1 Tax=Hyalomma asiaticum TaxID=266040 RepID=A0ACB7S7G5_HYAAI|nr:hypothetical protein HPB50_007958 [Hyalomma asiaticum]